MLRGTNHMIAQLCLALSLFFTCPALASYKTFANIQYGLTPAESGDLYLIDGGVHPLVVMIHGGGWSAGDKSLLNKNFVPAFLNNGFSVFNINYVLAEQGKPDTQWNIQVQGAQAAVRWVRSMALTGKINVDPNKIIAEGDSAGGHLALFLGSLDQPLPNTTPSPTRSNLYPGVSSKVAAVFSWEGPTDFTTPEGQQLAMLDGIMIFDRKPFAGNEALYRDASPMYRIGRQSAPTCIVVGLNDQVVHPSQQVQLAQKLEANGVKFTWIPFTGGHELPSGYTGTQLIQKGINCIKNFGIK